MNRLAAYLARLFAVDTLSFFVVAAFLVWITQALRLFDLVTAKGQDFLTLIGQATLTMPPLGLTIFFLCVGIGMARALRALQESRELHTIHASARTSALWIATGIFALGSMLAVSILAHWVEPWSKRAYSQWSEEVAADLLGRALNPNKFSEVVPGLVIVIGGRKRDGTIEDFYANDTRDPDTHRTYVAEEAVIVADENGYSLSLRNGAIQYARGDTQFSEVGFSRYALGLDRLVETTGPSGAVEQRSSLALIDSVRSRASAKPAIFELSKRSAEAVRIFAICLLALALVGFPHARRGNDRVPVEVIVLAFGLGDRVVSGLGANAFGVFSHFLGPLFVAGAAVFIIAWQLWGAKFQFRQRLTA